MDLPDTLISVGPLVVLHLYALGVAATLVGVLARREALAKCAFVLLAVTFVVQLVVLSAQIMQVGMDGLYRSVYLQMLACVLLLSGLILWLKRRLAMLLLVTAPSALIVCLMAQLVHGQVAFIPKNFSLMFTVAHVGGFFGSFVLMALAAGAGVLFLVQERRIKLKNRLSPLHKELPALSVLDKLNAFCTAVGFPLFTIGLLCGFIGARVAWGSVFSGDPKELFSLGVWVLFAVLFHQRLARGWQGHKPAVLAIWIFAACVFSLTVVNVFMTTHHSFFTTAS